MSTDEPDEPMVWITSNAFRDDTTKAVEVIRAGEVNRVVVTGNKFEITWLDQGEYEVGE